MREDCLPAQTAGADTDSGVNARMVSLFKSTQIL